jgi:uncharacterized repeat protein (TIGR01451 family)
MSSLLPLARRRPFLHLFLAFTLSAMFLFSLTAFLAAQATSQSDNSSPSNQSNTLVTPTIELIPISLAAVFTQPIAMAQAGDGRLFIVEQAGVIKALDRPYETMTATTFLDITDRVESGDEKGLLALAFHPNYDENGYFFVNYTHRDGEQLYSRLARFQVTADPAVADAGSELILLQLAQPYENHNGGDLAFGEDGYLYASFGDGGSADDPQNNAQNPQTLLGSMLRLDVDGGGSPPDCGGPTANYTLPANPLADGAGNNCDEIWAIGLRNPWRFSFDRQTYDLFIADVGQDQWEEVNFQPANGGGENYGWRCYEGSQPYISDGCDPNVITYTMPIAEYNQANGRCAVTGGYIYRGATYEALNGVYLYADFCSGEIWGLMADGGIWNESLLLDTDYNIATFGQDVDGELYVADRTGGQIYHIQAGEQQTPTLSITIDAPLMAEPDEPFTYTLTITNNSSISLTNTVVTNTVPLSATYVSGGDTFDGQVVSWNVGDLAPMSMIKLEWTATATQTVYNSDYRVTAMTPDGTVTAVGEKTAVTLIDALTLYFPIIFR